MNRFTKIIFLSAAIIMVGAKGEAHATPPDCSSDDPIFKVTAKCAVQCGPVEISVEADLLKLIDSSPLGDAGRWLDDKVNKEKQCGFWTYPADTRSCHDSRGVDYNRIIRVVTGIVAELEACAACLDNPGLACKSLCDNDPDLLVKELKCKKAKACSEALPKWKRWLADFQRVSQINLELCQGDHWDVYTKCECICTSASNMRRIRDAVDDRRHKIPDLLSELCVKRQNSNPLDPPQ